MIARSTPRPADVARAAVHAHARQTRCPTTLLGFVLCVASVCATPGALASTLLEPTFQRIGDAQSIADGVVTTLAEDQRGMIWIGTPAGLVRFDGYRFRMHSTDPDDPHGIGGNFVRSLLVARDGRLWIGTEADGLSVYDPRTERFVVHRHDPTVPDSIGAGAVIALAEDSDGTIWVGTRGGGLSRLAPDGTPLDRFVHREGDPASLPDDRIQSLLVGPRGTLWVGSWDGLARKSRGDPTFERVFSDPGAVGLAGKAVWTLLLAADGRLWAGSQHGDLALIDRASGRGSLVPQPDRPADAEATVFALAQQDADQVVIGRFNGLEVRDAQDGRLLQRLRHDPARPASLAGSDIRALLHDRSGWLWLGGYGSGLQRYDPRNRAIQVVRHDPGFEGVFSDPNVRSVLERSDGTIWIGTQERGIAIFDRAFHLIGGFRVDSEAGHGLGPGRVMGIAELEEGEVWVGSDSGLYRYDAETRRFTARGMVGKGRIRRMLAGQGSILWIATDDGLHRLDADRDTLARVDLVDGTELFGDINALAMEPDGRLWVGGERGLFALESGATALTPQKTAAGHELSHNLVVGLLVDRRGQLWVDTSDGLHRLAERGEDGLRFVQVSRQLGIAGQPFGANLLEDQRGRIWTHFHVYDPETKTVHELSPADGADIGTGWFRAYGTGPDGQLLFGGSQGLLVVSPERFEPHDYAPPVVATELKIDGTTISAGALESGLTLQPGQRSFAVEFSALDYSDPSRNRYRYRLHGFDRDWVETGSNYRVATYGNLWPGTYELEVQGSNRNGVFSPNVLRVPVRVLPAYWQSAWFGAIVLLALSALVWLGIRWRTARSEARALQLQQVVEARTRELREAKESAESALQELTSAQRQLIASEKMASLGALVAGIAHEVNTPIGIAVTAASHLRDSSRALAKKVEGGKLTRSDFKQWVEQADEAGDLILSSLERAGHLIGSFKQVAVDQSSEQRRSFDLNVFLDEVKTSLHPIYRRTPFKLHVECPAGIEMDSYPGALFQVLTNLVNNALLHGLHGREGGRMTVRATPKGSEVEIEFADDGVGMSPEVAARAFDPYFTTRRETGGSGLGLHLVQQLTRDVLGGQLSLHSAPGEGCRFVLVLPRRAPAAHGEAGSK